MLKRPTIAVVAALAGTFVVSAVASNGGTEHLLPNHNQAQTPAGASGSASGLVTGPLSDDQVQQRAQELIANQHKSDAALDVYERVEHYVDRTGGANPQVVLDKTYRVIPTGGGTMKILIKDGANPVDAAAYDRQLRTLRDILQMMSNESDPRAKAAREKYEKRKQERNTFVDASQNAFLVKWLNEETLSGRTCDVFELDPNPNFHSHSMFQEALAHVKGKIWVDRQNIQLLRGEAYVLSDIYFGGGILGKLTRGSSISMNQAEIAPGLWEPSHFQYDYTGRKFLFPFEQHQVIEASHYKRIGLPPEALAAITAELASSKGLPGDP